MSLRALGGWLFAEFTCLVSDPISSSHHASPTIFVRACSIYGFKEVGTIGFSA